MMRKLIALTITFAFVVGNLSPVPLFARTSQEHSILSAPSKVNGPEDPTGINIGFFAKALQKAVKGKNKLSADQLFSAVGDVIEKKKLEGVKVVKKDYGDQAEIVVIFKNGYSLRIASHDDVPLSSILSSVNFTRINNPKVIIAIGELNSDQANKLLLLADSAQEASRVEGVIKLAAIDRSVMQIQVEQSPGVLESLSSVMSQADEVHIVAAMHEKPSASLHNVIDVSDLVNDVNVSKLSLSKVDFNSTQMDSISSQGLTSSSTTNVDIASTSMDISNGDFLEPPPPPKALSQVGAESVLDGMQFPFGGGPPPEEHTTTAGISTYSTLGRFLPTNVRDSTDGRLMTLYAHLADYLDHVEFLQAMRQENLDHGGVPRDSRVVALEAATQSAYSGLQAAIIQAADVMAPDSALNGIKDDVRALHDGLRAQAQSTVSNSSGMIDRNYELVASRFVELQKQIDEPIVFVSHSPTYDSVGDGLKRLVDKNRGFWREHDGDSKAIERDRAMSITRHMLSRDLMNGLADEMKTALHASVIPAWGSIADRLANLPIALVIGMSSPARAAILKAPAEIRAKQGEHATVEAIWYSRELYEAYWAAKTKLSDKSFMGEKALSEAEANKLLRYAVMLVAAEEMTGVLLADPNDSLEGELLEDVTNYAVLDSLSPLEMDYFIKLNEIVGQGPDGEMHVRYARSYVTFLKAFKKLDIESIATLKERGIDLFERSTWGIESHGNEVWQGPWGAQYIGKPLGAFVEGTRDRVIDRLRLINTKLLDRTKLAMLDWQFGRKVAREGERFSNLMAQVYAARNIERRLEMRQKQLGVKDLETSGRDILRLESEFLRYMDTMPQDPHAQELYKNLREAPPVNVAIDLSLINSWSDVQGLILALESLNKMKPEGIFLHVLYGSKLSREQAVEILTRANLISKVRIIARDPGDLIDQVIKQLKDGRLQIAALNGFDLDDEDVRDLIKNMTTLILDGNNWQSQIKQEALGALVKQAHVPSGVAHMPQNGYPNGLKDLTGEDKDLFRVLLSRPAVEVERALVLGVLLGSSGKPGLYGTTGIFTPEQFQELITKYIESGTFGIEKGRAFKVLLEDGIFMMQELKSEIDLRGALNNRMDAYTRTLVNSL